jgi:hypothetical protein
MHHFFEEIHLKVVGELICRSKGHQEKTQCRGPRKPPRTEPLLDESLATNNL